MQIRVLQVEQIPAYDKFLLTSDCSLLYYSSKYKNFLTSLLDCRDQYLIATSHGEILGVLPLMYTENGGRRVYNSLPFYGSNGGLLCDAPEARSILINAYNEIACSKMTIASTIISNPFIFQQNTGIHYTHTDSRIAQFTSLSNLPSDRGALLAQLDSSARRNVKKAHAQELSVNVDYTQIERLREMHQKGMRAINGMPKQDNFFELLPRHFEPGKDYDLYVCLHEGTIIAALLLFYFNRTVEYFIPAVDIEYRSIQPMPLILATAMADAARKGFTRWNWGGTWESQTGVYRFKKKWAASEVRYQYFTQLNDPGILDWHKEAFADTFPNFYVIPFSVLRSNK
ncbi:MAG: GNAT family N-acetyltransferase [Syntrophobacteraceae bacterium]